MDVRGRDAAGRVSDLGRKPVDECSAEELHRELVTDRVRGLHTP